MWVVKLKPEEVISLVPQQVRGATAHFDAVVSGATGGVLNAGLDSGVPVIFCVMTTDTMEQASAAFNAVRISFVLLDGCFFSSSTDDVAPWLAWK